MSIFDIQFEDNFPISAAFFLDITGQGLNDNVIKSEITTWVDKKNRERITLGTVLLEFSGADFHRLEQNQHSNFFLEADLKIKVFQSVYQAISRWLLTQSHLPSLLMKTAKL